MLKSYVVLTLFIGLFLVMQGIHEQRLKTMNKLIKTEYKFVPRTLYDEVLTNNDVQSTYKNYFDSPDPWYERNIGVGMR
jgi:hypothetical protein